MKQPIASVAQYAFSIIPLIFMAAWYAPLQSVDVVSISVLALSLLASYNIYGYIKTAYKTAPAFWVFPASLVSGVIIGVLFGGAQTTLLSNIVILVVLAFFSTTLNKSVFSMLLGYSSMVLLVYASILYALASSLAIIIFLDASLLHAVFLLLSPAIEHSLAFLAESKYSLLMYYSLLLLTPPYLHVLSYSSLLFAAYLAGINAARVFLGKERSGLVLGLDYFARTSLALLVLSKIISI